MRKKYYSSDEFYFVDPATNEKTPYEGYVLIKDGKPYKYDTGEELAVGDNYITKINLSDQYFDRLLEKKLELPHNLNDCTFAPNDFLKASVINRIVKNIDENNQYIFQNCLLPQNTLPIAQYIPVLNPHRPFKPEYFEDSEGYEGAEVSTILPLPYEEEPEAYGDVDGWWWSNISYSYVTDIHNKAKWNDNVAGYNWFTDDIKDCLLISTDKAMYRDSEELVRKDGRDRLFAVFMMTPANIKLMNISLCPEGVLGNGLDPYTQAMTLEEAEISAQPRMYNDIAKVNQTKGDKVVSNFDIATITNIDPEDNSSFEFRNITGFTHDGDYLYVIDDVIKGLFQYDISRCLTDRGVATNHIILSNYIQGKGDIEDDYFFDQPISVAAHNGIVAVLDKGSLCVKVFDRLFNYKFTLKHGGFIRQNPVYVTICPYDFNLDGQIIEEGAFLIMSETNGQISFDIYTKEGLHVGSRQIKYVDMLQEVWRDEKTGSLSSVHSPLYNKEKLLKVEFSYNNSNIYYIITTKRIIKLQLSQFTIPLGIISYYDKALTSDELIWSKLMQPWKAVCDMYNNMAKWSYNRSDSVVNYPQNKCFALAGIPELDKDIIFNIIDNRTYFGNGEIQRWDNSSDKNKLYYKSGTAGEYTYDAETNGLPNRPVYVKVPYNGPAYIPVNIAPEGKIPYYIPQKVNDMLTIGDQVNISDLMHNSILFYEEPNVYKSSLLRYDLKLISDEELNFENNTEYYSHFTMNKILYKLYLNLNEIKKYIYGTFVGGYSVENILTYDHINIDKSIQLLGDDQRNFIFGENEQTAIVLNRCFTNLYNVQLNIIEKMQTKFTSSIQYGMNTFKII